MSAVVTVPNRLGVHFQVFAEAWRGADRERAVAGAREAGFDFVEVAVFDPVDFDVAGARTALSTGGERMGAVVCTAPGFDADVSSADPAVAARGEAHLLRCVEIASELESDWLVGLTYGAWGRYPGPPTVLGRAHAVAALGRVAARADELGVSIGLEVVNRFENNLLNTSAQARALIEEVGAANLYVQLDAYHAHLEEASQAHAVAGCSGRLGYLHVGENTRGPLGTGAIDLRGLLRAAVAAGFTGPIAFEAFSAHVVGETGAAALCVWRDLWDDSVALARHARELLSAELEAAWTTAGEVAR